MIVCFLLLILNGECHEFCVLWSNISQLFFFLVTSTLIRLVKPILTKTKKYKYRFWLILIRVSHLVCEDLDFIAISLNWSINSIHKEIRTSRQKKKWPLNQTETVYLTTSMFTKFDDSSLDIFSLKEIKLFST